jgi:carbonic anhydrase
LVDGTRAGLGDADAREAPRADLVAPVHAVARVRQLLFGRVRRTPAVLHDEHIQRSGHGPIIAIVPVGREGPKVVALGTKVPFRGARPLSCAGMAPFDDLLDANRQYQTRFHDSGVAGKAARGLAVLTCIDSRIDPLAMLGLRAGDAKIIRNAGARVTDDALRSLVLAANLLDVTRVCVVQHTECAMVGSTDDEMRRVISEKRGVDASGWDFLASTDQGATLRADLERLASCPLLPPDLEVEGFVFDVRSGALVPAEQALAASHDPGSPSDHG